MNEDATNTDHMAVFKRAVELMGGREKYIASIEADYHAMKERWNKDVTTIGRILRAHLHVEHHLTEYLQHVNPQLGELDEARITFNQKVNLLPAQDPRIDFLRPGIKHLNKIRNRLAHNLEATVTEDDKVVFLAPGLFSAFREEGVKGTDRKLATNPIDVLEEFAEFASSMLNGPSTESSKVHAQALAEFKETKAG